MKQRPVLSVRLTTTDKFLNGLAVVMLVVFWGYTAWVYSSQPAVIPIHFNAAGEADNWGPRFLLWVLPIIATLLAGAFTVLNRYPHVFNYPVKVTPENALRQYTLATRMLRGLRLSIILLFFSAMYMGVRSAQVHIAGVGVWVLPFALTVVGIPIIAYILAASRSGEVR